MVEAAGAPDLRLGDREPDALPAVPRGPRGRGAVRGVVAAVQLGLPK